MEGKPKRNGYGLNPSIEMILSTLRELDIKEFYAPVVGKPLTIVTNTTQNLLSLVTIMAYALVVYRNPKHISYSVNHRLLCFSNIRCNIEYDDSFLDTFRNLSLTRIIELILFPNIFSFYEVLSYYFFCRSISCTLDSDIPI
jgi:adenosine deaminase